MGDNCRHANYYSNFVIHSQFFHAEIRVEMKNIKVGKCSECPHIQKFDEGHDFCEEFDFDVPFPNGGVHNDCELDENLDKDFNKWLCEFFPNILEEYKSYQKKEVESC